MRDTKVILDGDGGFSVVERQHHYIFKPVSVQASSFIFDRVFH